MNSALPDYERLMMNLDCIVCGRIYIIYSQRGLEYTEQKLNTIIQVHFSNKYDKDEFIVMLEPFGIPGTPWNPLEPHSPLQFPGTP